MASTYFNNFKGMTYTLEANTIPNQVLTNVLARVAFREGLISDAHLFYPYQVKESDSPEIIAHKLYGSPHDYWIVTLFNNIIDPLMDWPMTYISFQAYIIEEYGSLETAQTTIHHYEKIVEKTTSEGYYSSFTYWIDETEYDTLVVPIAEVFTFSDGSTASVTTSRNSVTVYDYETILNENRRNIKLLKPDYTSIVKQELERLSL